MSRLSVSLLGPFRVSLDGQLLAGLESDKVRALLAFLMVESKRPHRREELVGLFWPERPEAVARQDLSQALSNLRRVTRDRTTCPPFLDISHQTLRFNTTSDHELDTSTFLSLLDGCLAHFSRPQPYCPQCMANMAAAAELVLGPFLSGFGLKDCPAFEEWMLLQQERFEQLAIQVLQRLSVWHSRRGGTEQAIAYTRRWLELDPWQERAHRQLMGILARSGQRNAALEQYEVCRAVLAHELEIEPEAETQHLFAAIRDGSLAAGPAFVPSSMDMPVPMLPLLGREAELAEIENCLRESDSRLLVLVGPGGSGKTHLALEVALRQGDAYADGATIVSLAAIQIIDAVAPAIAQAAGLALQPDRPAARQVLDYLREKEMLLVLDNAEHLLPAQSSAQPGFAGFILEILRTAPRVRILATSRVRLNMYSEHLLHVRGLPAPELDDEEALLASYPAVQLFLATACRVRSAYTPDRDDLGAIASLCRLLNGMPLAILLAASWIEVLTPAQILEQVANRYDFLAAEWQDMPPRQRSVRAVLDHSWELLSAQEQEVFPGLSVFRGGFTTAAAEQVAGVSLGELRRLAGKSFLVRLPNGRYEMHELLRQFAQDKLARTEDAVRERHSAYYLVMTQQRGEELKGPRQGTALAELANEAENLRKAWEWATTQPKVAGLGTALECLCRLFERLGRCEEGVALCTAAAGRFHDATDDEGRRIWARLLVWQGFFEFTAGRTECANRLAEQSLVALEQVVGDARSERAFALRVIGGGAYEMGRWREAEDLYRQSLALYQALDDPWNTARVLCDLGELANMNQGNDAERWLKASLGLWRAIGDRESAAEALTLLGGHLALRGNLAEGERLELEAIEIYRELGDRAGRAEARVTLSGVLCFSGRYLEALPLVEESIRNLRRLGKQLELDTAELLLRWIQANLGMYELSRQLLEARMASLPVSEASARMAYDRYSQALYALLDTRQDGLWSNYEAAHRFAEESSAAFHQLGHIDAGAAWATLGLAAHYLGRREEARRHLCQALRSARDSRAPQVTAVVLAHLAAILAEDEPERAVELNALAIRHPYVGNSRLWQDLLESNVVSAAARLPPDVVKAAQARGQGGDLIEATESWLRKLGMDQPGVPVHD